MHRRPAVALLTTLLLATAAAQAQEKLSRTESLRLAFVAASDLQAMLGTPIPTDPDVKRPVVVRDEDYGGMILPESKLRLEQLEQAGATPTPVGQLWLHKLVPLGDGEPVSASQLHPVTVRTDEGEATVTLCALGVRKAAAGLELVVYGKGKEPVLHTPLQAKTSTAENPVDLSADRTDEGGLLTVRILGRYEARFMVTDPDRY